MKESFSITMRTSVSLVHCLLSPNNAGDEGKLAVTSLQDPLIKLTFVSSAAHRFSNLLTHHFEPAEKIQKSYPHASKMVKT